MQMITKKQSTQPSQSCSSKGKVQVGVASVEEEGGGGDKDGGGRDDEEQDDRGEHLDLQSTQQGATDIYCWQPAALYIFAQTQANVCLKPRSFQSSRSEFCVYEL